MKKFSLVLFSLCLLGCATTSGAKYANTWVGHPESELSSVLGPADDVQEISTRERIVTYHTFSKVFVPAHNTAEETTLVGNATMYSSSYGKTPAQNKGNHCKTDFRIKDGRIVSWSAEGKGCMEDSNPA